VVAERRGDGAGLWWSLHHEHHERRFPYRPHAPSWFLGSELTILQHGEGGTLVGAPMANKRVVIIDDVMTAGTAIRESIAILREQPGAQLVGIVQLLDRQERGKGATSTIQEVEAEFKVPVVPIVSLADIIDYLRVKGGYETELKKIEEYRAEYGITV
jgi:orotate phosphoribosyltransferase